MAAGLVTSRPQSQIAADIAPLVESMFFANCEHERNGSKRTYAVDLCERFCFRKRLLRHLSNQFIEGAYLCTELGDLVD